MTETRQGEVRFEPGRRLVGQVMQYGKEARVQLPDGTPVRERFAAFAFDSLRKGGEVCVNLMHDPSLTIANSRSGSRSNLHLIDSPKELRMVATLPQGDAFDDVLRIVSDGIAQTSVEFRALSERFTGDLRVLLEAELSGIGIVDRGAYAGEIEVKRRGRGIAGRLDYGKSRTTPDRGKVRKKQFSPGAFDRALQG